MSGFDSFLGNKRLIERLKNDIASGTLSHAYIIEGEKGCGKRTLARLICSAVSCGSDNFPCMKCIACDKISRAQAPDVITVEAEHDRVQLGVDVIRRLREDAYFAPIELPKKFYIIPDARSMNVQAQNALLKILEEPPSHVVFLLLCENADCLLPTIRSRAPTLRLEALSDETVEAFLLSNSDSAKMSPEKLKMAVKLARGSAGKALELLSGNGSEKAMELYEKAGKYLLLLAHRKNAADELAFHEYATKLVASRNREDMARIYALIADAVRDMINAKLTSSPTTIFYPSPKEAEEISHEFSIGALMRLVALFSDAASASEGNINISLSMVKTACLAAKRI